MERFSRILIVIFILSLVNLGLNGYLLNRINKLQTTSKSVYTSTVFASPTPKTTDRPTTNEDLKNTDTISNDISIIKAEIRAIRDSLELNGIVFEAPKP